MDDLLSEFIAETQESLDALTNVVVALEADPSDLSLLDQLCRFFHTVKGSCGFLNLPRFERLSHAAEDVLSDFRSEGHIPDAATISAVLAVMDRIAELCVAVHAGESLPDRDDDELIAILRRCRQPGMLCAGEDVSPTLAAQKTIALPWPGDDDGTSSRALPTTRTVRLPLRLIDQLMNGMSDMVLTRNELARQLRNGDATPESVAAFERLSSSIADMRDIISKTRMQPVDRLFQAAPRMVRDLSRELGKVIHLSLDGGGVDMDREMIEMVVDPLTHIVRNSISHGIETPDERRMMGKTEAGLLSLSAYQSGSQIVIEVTDDGRGVDVDAVANKVVRAGLMSAHQMALLDHQEKLDLIFTPGISTAEKVTPVSGRGVGMDVVRANIERLGGTISLYSEPGRGLTITMRVPMTLTIIPGLTLRAGGLGFAIPQSAVIEIAHETNPMVSVCERDGALTATIRDTRYSMVNLETVLGLPVLCESGPRTLMLVRSATGVPYILGVSLVDNHEELVIRPAAPVVMASGLYAGMTLPDNGQPMLLLDAAGVAQVVELPLIVENVSAVSDDEADRARKMVHYQALRFTELTGEERVIRLSLVDRVEKIPLAAFSVTGGRGHVTIGGQSLLSVHPVHAETLPTGVSEVHCIRIRDGVVDLCYPVRAVLDVQDVPQDMDRAASAGLVAGVVLLDGQPVEVIDDVAILALNPDFQREEVPSLRCLIADREDIWNRQILAPLLMQAGYQVLWGEEAGADTPSDIIMITGSAANQEDTPAGSLPAPVLRLRSSHSPAHPADDSIYRYDRAAVLNALAAAAGQRSAA
ncbi:MAG: chemotaxis protein CheA [Sphingobium sp.]|nr:chemotaxis protein CheA [Sphingobium sp.]